MGLRGHFYPCMYHVMDILHCLGQVCKTREIPIYGIRTKS